MSLTTSWSWAEVPTELGNSILNRQLMLLMLHFLPILWLSVVPCGMVQNVSLIVPATAIVGWSVLKSMNFSSPVLLNLP